jgi:hypothetical protein
MAEKQKTKLKNPVQSCWLKFVALSAVISREAAEPNEPCPTVTVATRTARKSREHRNLVANDPKRTSML